MKNKIDNMLYSCAIAKDLAANCEGWGYTEIGSLLGLIIDTWAAKNGRTLKDCLYLLDQLVQAMGDVHAQHGAFDIK